MPEILETRIAPAALIDVFQFANAAGTIDLVETDSAGNIYLAGTFTGTIVTGGADPLVVSTNDPAGDIYYAKLSPTGVPLWLGRWGGPGPEVLGDLKVDTNDGVFVTGSFDSTGAGFGGSGPYATTPGHPELFLFKVGQTNGAPKTNFDGDGQLQYGDPAGRATGTSLAIGSGNIIYVGGTFNGVINLGNPTVTSDGEDGLIVKMNSDSGVPDVSFGNLGFLTVSFGSGFNDELFNIELTNGGDVIAGIRFSIVNPPQPVPDVFGLQKLLGTTGALENTFGSGGLLGVSATDGDTDFAIDSNDRIVVASFSSTGGQSGSAFVLRYDNAGQQDLTFAGGGGHVILAEVQSIEVLLDAQDRIYVGGVTNTANYITRLAANGNADSAFGNATFVSVSMPAIFGKRASLQNPHMGMAIDPNGYLLLRDAYVGATTDLDPTKSIFKLAPRNGLGAGMEDTFIARIDPSAIVSGQTVRIFAGPGPNGLPQEVLVTLTGPGSFRLGNVNENGSIDSIELFDTTLASTLTIVGSKLIGGRTVGKILAAGAQQHIGAIKIAPQFTLGNGAPDSDVDLLITGKVNTLVLGDINQNAIIKLGVDLPYNVASDTTTPDTYNNRPTLTVGNITGPGVVIENIGDGTSQGVGGGGFGNIVIQSWAFLGYLRTTQSIGNFTVKEGDFFGVLEIDKFKNGEETVAGAGVMTVQNGAWGSSGTEVEGYVAGFNADEFLAGASIQAGGIGTITTDEGGFSGTLTLTDAAANAVPVFTVATDFTGKVVSNAPLKKIVIKGDFKGSLTAPSIAAITAFSFLGATTDEHGDPARLGITTTAGLLGLITAKSGVVKDFVFTSNVAPFSGIKVIKTKLTTSTAGVENVSISAPSIGPITVTLAASPNATGVNLTGILNSQFLATGDPAIAKVGNVNVKLSGANGSSLGLSNVAFGGSSIGNVLVNVSKGKDAAATAHAIENASFAAVTSIGNFSVLGTATQAQVNGLQLTSGGKIGAVSVKATKAEFAAVSDSAILAGQALDFTGATTTTLLKAKLLASSLTSFTAGGAVSGTVVASGANIGAVTIGGSVDQSLILAGTRLGANRTLGGGDDAFQRAAKIASVTVKGAFSQTSIAAGIDPVNNTFGDSDDIFGADTAVAVQGSEIGTVTIGAGTIGTAAAAHTFAIEAGKIAKLLVKGQPPLKDFTLPGLLDIGTAGEDASDIVVRVL